MIILHQTWQRIPIQSPSAGQYLQNNVISSTTTVSLLNVPLPEIGREFEFFADKLQVRSDDDKDSRDGPQLVALSSFCSVLADPFCSVTCSSTMADFFVVPVGIAERAG